MSNRRKPATHVGWTAAARHLEDVFASAGPGQLEALVEAAAPGFADQMRAAVSEALTIRARNFAAARAAGPGKVREVASDATARTQLYAHFLRVTTGLAEGTVPHCPHIRLDAPQPAIVVVFGPSVDCHACYPKRARPRLSEREEHTCDLCRTYIPGQTIHAVLPQCGPFTLLAGMCDQCRDRLGTGQ